MKRNETHGAKLTRSSCREVRSCMLDFLRCFGKGSPWCFLLERCESQGTEESRLPRVWSRVKIRDGSEAAVCDTEQEHNRGRKERCGTGLRSLNHDGM